MIDKNCEQQCYDSREDKNNKNKIDTNNWF